MKKIIFIALSVLICLTGCGQDEEFVELRDVYSSGSVAEATVNNVTENAGEISANSDSSAEDQIDSLPIVVYICGEVNKPGVYELEPGSRIFDAINVAGGYSKDAYVESVNLAQVISDEQMIYIPSADDVQNMTEGQIIANTVDITRNSTSNSKVNINTASISELTTIPGIGESKANKIISYRTEHGKFNSIEDIMNISGIKEGLFNKVKDYICVK